MNRFRDRSEPSIGIGSTACRIGFLVVFMCGFRDFFSVTLLHFFTCSSSIIDEELIFTFDNLIFRIIHELSIDEVIDVLPTSCEVHLSIVIHEVATSRIPEEIREEVSPGRGCHMNMDEIPFILMEVNTILRFHIGRDITSRDFLHINILGKIPLFLIYKYGEIRMMMYLVWARNEHIGHPNCDENDDDI